MHVDAARMPTPGALSRSAGGRVAAVPSGLVDALAFAARSAFAKHFRLYQETDQLSIHEEPFQVRLHYQSVRASAPTGPGTFAHCRLQDASERMWLSHIQVAPRLRGRGHGRELVLACEATARALGLASVAVYPLVRAVGFWDSLGYRVDPAASRVLQKRL